MPERNDPVVAIVDDEAQMIRAYEMLFRRHNIPVAFFALNGEEALEQFHIAVPRPKVVIVDYRLPGMDGLALMGKIRSVEPATQVIMISGDITVGPKCLESGAACFFKKPTGIREIIDMVQKLLSV